MTDTDTRTPATSPTRGSDRDVDTIYEALERGVGRELVDDDNVEALITLARDRHNTQLEYLLREWRSPCGEDAEAPDLSEIQGLPPR